MSQETHYGLAEVLIQDLSEGQQKANLLKRIWRRASSIIGESNNGRGKIIVQQIDLIGVQEFVRLTTEFAGKGTILMVHGYANSFDDAIQSSARAVYKIKIDHLEFLPILFSWPSRGSTTAYLPDTNSAENSEFALRGLLDDLVSGPTNRREVNVLAHSHGTKILVRSLCEKSQDRAAISHRLKRLILVEPDVDEEFLRQRVDTLANASEQIVIYHSKNDRALRVAELLFNSVRAGRAGLPNRLQEAAVMSDAIEVIDASQVAMGLSKHAPHIESPEVMNDIYHLLRGENPSQRFYLKMTDRESRRWQMVRA